MITDTASNLSDVDLHQINGSQDLEQQQQPQSNVQSCSWCGRIVRYFKAVYQGEKSGAPFAMVTMTTIFAIVGIIFLSKPFNKDLCFEPSLGIAFTICAGWGTALSFLVCTNFCRNCDI